MSASLAFVPSFPVPAAPPEPDGTPDPILNSIPDPAATGPTPPGA